MPNTSSVPTVWKATTTVSATSRAGVSLTSEVTTAKANAANRRLRRDLKHRIQGGMPVYAECGGLMYLSRCIEWQDKKADMVGIIPADTVMHRKPQGRGYVRMEKTGAFPWQKKPACKQVIKAHEFHYSALENLGDTGEFAFQVLRGTGIDGEYDGIVYKNLFACYTHQRNTRQNQWVRQFTDFIRANPGPWT